MPRRFNRTDGVHRPDIADVAAGDLDRPHLPCFRIAKPRAIPTDEERRIAREVPSLPAQCPA